jgi:hypothetical protein
VAMSHGSSTRLRASGSCGIVAKREHAGGRERVLGRRGAFVEAFERGVEMMAVGADEIDIAVEGIFPIFGSPACAKSKPNPA